MADSERPAPSGLPRPPPSPAAALSKGALRVKDLAVDLASDLTHGYRRSTRFFKLRAAAVGLWAVASLLTLWLACPSGGPTNSLGAEVQLSEELLGTQILVWNGSGRIWTDVTLTLDGGWRWQTPTFRDGQRLVIAVGRFSRDGAAAPANLRPRSLTIECRQGSVTAPLASRGP
jgi:hypothetical protein